MRLMLKAPIALLDLLSYYAHGETDWNAEGRFQGQTDIPLNAKGVAQATQNGVKLAETFLQNNYNIADWQFIASPLGRTRQTMALVREGLGLPKNDYQTDARLLELSFGTWENHTLRELEAKFPGDDGRTRQR